MQGNFQYYNPTKIYFGKDALSYLGGELDHYGKKILVIYGGGSVVKNGILDKVVAVLKSSGKEIYFDGGVPSNPTTETLYDGITRARECKADFILAVGGGSVCDYAKAVAVSVNCDDDPWEKYYIRFEEPTCPVLPLGCVLTMAGTGSEMNGTAVITTHAHKAASVTMGIVTVKGHNRNSLLCGFINQLRHPLTFICRYNNTVHIG